MWQVTYWNVDYWFTTYWFLGSGDGGSSGSNTRPLKAFGFNFGF